MVPGGHALPCPGPALWTPTTSLEWSGLFPFLGEVPTLLSLIARSLSDVGKLALCVMVSGKFWRPKAEPPARRQPFSPPSLSSASHWLMCASGKWQASLGGAVLGVSLSEEGGGANQKNQANTPKNRTQPRLKQECGGDRECPSKVPHGGKGWEGEQACPRPCAGLTGFLSAHSLREYQQPVPRLREREREEPQHDVRAGPHQGDAGGVRGPVPPRSLLCR